MQTQPLNAGVAVATTATGDGNASGVSWGAILAGAAAAAALSFILLILGMGLGLSSVSPYQYNSTPLGAASIAWIAFMQLAASGIGGYMAGRLRVKWASIHGDEVYFRDTAHGLLAWAVATLVTVAVLAGGARAALSGAIDTGAAVATAAAPAAGAAAANAGGRGNTYFADMVLRSPNGDVATEAQRNEINRILLTDLASGKISGEDRVYLAQLVAKRTGMTQAEAEQRVDLIYAQATQAANEAKAKAMAAAEEARKTAAHSALWMFVALLLGAFIAAISAIAGGRNRDHARVLVVQRTI
ncbi:hypothetical protein GJ698_18365 [Pseudoduganella sp. FT26W]|uniref:Transmembrane protein n=1 Tax=Duganella aquatilis TaxID=2666082 RepID=A0A844DDE8_9BURK|nr:hypothetical protein [Duganella aquatilis]MRW86040.1 hypothetical protein [Duganella aquatilis]